MTISRRDILKLGAGAAAGAVTTTARNAAARDADVFHSRHAGLLKRPVSLAARFSQPVGLGGVCRSYL